MKVLYKLDRDEYVLELHFDRELPLFPRPQQTTWWAPPAGLNRRSQVWKLAQRMARENRGRFVVELADPQRTYAEFLHDLLTMPGVNSICGARRYALYVEVGRAFEPQHLARAIAECVRRHFYAEDSLTLSEMEEEHSDNESEICQLAPSQEQAPSA